MSAPGENKIDSTAPANPEGERVGPGLSRQTKPSVAQTRRAVLDTLLGDSILVATDDHGTDPYNATGRQFRR